MEFDANSWLIIITGTIAAILAGLPAVANFILTLRAKREAHDDTAVIVAQSVVNEEKIDKINAHTNGIVDKLVAVTSRASFKDGVDAQKATQNAEEGQERRSGDTEKKDG